MKGVLARKIGMTTSVCAETGQVCPVTLLEVPEATILQVKTEEKDGYTAAVLGAFPRKNFGKNENKKFKFIKEVQLSEGEEAKKGERVTLETMKETELVKITGTSKGKGFAGVIKRYNFSRGPETHGSTHHREPGSVGTCAKPARIIKGKKMPGRMGHAQVTLRDIPVVDVDMENNLIALKGPVPGAKDSFVFIWEK